MMRSVVFFCYLIGSGKPWGWALFVVLWIEFGCLIGSMIGSLGSKKTPPVEPQSAPDSQPTQKQWRGSNGPGFRGLGER